MKHFFGEKANDPDAKYPELNKLVREVRNTNGQEAIVLRAGGSVEFVARSKGSGRGYSVDVLVLDEAQELTDEQLAALQPTISAATNPQTIMTGTPPKDGGEPYVRMRTDGVEGNSKRLCWHEWSVELGADLDSVENWAATNPAYGLRLHHDTIADEREAFADDEFGRERLGMWPDDKGGSVITAGMLQGVTDPESRRHGDAVVFAVSAEEDRSSATIMVATQNGQGKVHLERVETLPGVAWVPARLKELAARRRPRAIVLDSSGAAGSLLPDLQRLNITVLLAPAEVLKKACGGLYDGLRDKEIALTGLQSDVTASLLAAKKVVSNGAWVWRRKEGSSVLFAATLAHYGWAVKKPIGNGTSRRVVVLS